MSEVILLSIIALLVAILFFNAYLYDKTLEEIKAPQTQLEKELKDLKEAIRLAKYRARATEESHNELPSSNPSDDHL
jgi:cell division protein FtsB